MADVDFGFGAHGVHAVSFAKRSIASSTPPPGAPSMSNAKAAARAILNRGSSGKRASACARCDPGARV